MSVPSVECMTCLLRNAVENFVGELVVVVLKRADRHPLAQEHAHQLFHLAHRGSLGEVGLARRAEDLAPLRRQVLAGRPLGVVVLDRLRRDRHAEQLLQVVRDRRRLVVGGEPPHHMGSLRVVQLVGHGVVLFIVGAPE
jgi:hypothetical protein